MIQKKLEGINKLKVLVIGETIIDQYVFCEALGKSGKGACLSLTRPRNSRVFRWFISYCSTLKQFL